MSEAPDVESDWRKARAFLVTFSTIVLLAWYFSADISTISILGFSLRPKENADDIWAAISIINVYFLLRYYQKCPIEQRRPADTNHLTYENILIKNYIRMHKHELHRLTDKARLEANPSEKRDIIGLNPEGTMEYRDNFNTPESSAEGSPIEGYRQYSKNRINLNIWYSYAPDTHNETFTLNSSIRVTVTPSAYEISKARVSAWIANTLFNPWASDYILPFIIGLISSGVAFFSWLVVKYQFLDTFHRLL